MHSIPGSPYEHPGYLDTLGTHIMSLEVSWIRGSKMTILGHGTHVGYRPCGSTHEYYVYTVWHQRSHW